MAGPLEFGADALAQPADLGGDIGLAQAQHIGHLAVTAVVQIEQQQGAIERRLGVDEAVQGADLLFGLRR